MAAPTIKGTPTTTIDADGGASSAVTLPSGGASGDAYIVIATHYAGGATINEPTLTGFTVLATATLTGAESTRVTVFGRVRDGSEGGTLTVNVTGTGSPASGYTYLSAFVVQNADLSGGISAALDSSAATASSTGTSANLPEETTVSANCGVFATVSAFTDAITNTPSTWTQQVNLDGGFHRVWTKTQASAGSTGTASVTFNSSTGNVRIVFALKEAGGSGATATPSVVTATASVPAPTVTRGAGATPAVVTASVSVPSPTVSTSTNANVSATVVTATANVPAPSVSVGRTVTATVVTATASVPSPTVATLAGTYPVSRSGRKWLDQNGDPYILKCMASWGMPQRLSDADITTALEGAQGRGFNSVLIALFGYALNGTWTAYENIAGADVFTGTPYRSTFGAAWSTVDHIVEEAARLEMTVVMSTYAALDATGPRADMESAYTASATNLYNYGFELATRYAAYPNIVWHMGADDDWAWGTTIASAFDKIHEGILAAEGSTHRLVVGEPANAATSYAQWPSVFTGSGGFTYVRFDANSVYSWNDQAAVQFEAVWSESGATTFPVWDCEPPYVGNTDATGSANRQELRERIYATFIEGGCGINYGHEDWWPFGADTFTYTESLTWDQVMTSSSYLADAERAWTLLDAHVLDSAWAPASLLSAGEGSTDTKAAVGASGSSILAYIPSSRSPITVDTTALTGTANARLRWWDPTNGSYTSIASSEAQNASRTVTHPGNNSAGDGDWVLVVDFATDVTVSATVVTATVSVPAPTASASSTATATVVTATVSVPAPTVTTGAGATPAVVTATVSVPSPTVSAGSTASPAVVTATVSVPAPSVTAGGNANVTATVVTATASVPAPTVSAGSSVTATVVTATTSVPAPTVGAGAGVTATVVTATVSVPAPSVSTSGNANVSATVVTATVSVPGATVVVDVFATVYGPALTYNPPPILTHRPPSIITGRSA